MENAPKEFLYEKTCHVRERLGLCARPCAAIVLENARICGPDNLFKIFARKPGNDYEAMLSSILSMMMLAASCDSELVIYTHDPECITLVDQMADFIEKVRIDTHFDSDVSGYYRIVDEAFIRERRRRLTA